MKDFRKLMVREKAHQLTLAIYQVTAAFPSEETYGLTVTDAPCGSVHPIEYS